jgi:hypothetical protein
LTLMCNHKVNLLILQKDMAVHHESYGIPPNLNAVEMQTIAFVMPLEPLLHTSSDSSEVAVHLAGVLAQDQADNGLPCHMDVLETSQDVDL